MMGTLMWLAEIRRDAYPKDNRHATHKRGMARTALILFYVLVALMRQMEPQADGSWRVPEPDQMQAARDVLDQIDPEWRTHR